MRLPGHILISLLAGLPGLTGYGQEDSAVVYRLTLQPEQKGVQVDGLVRMKGHEFKGWTGTSWLGERAKIEMAPEPGQIRFRYFIRFEQDEVRIPSDPAIGHDFCMTFLDQILVGPVLGEPVKQYGVEVFAPDGWKVGTSLGPYAGALVFDSYDRMAGTALMAGDFVIVSAPFTHSEGQRKTRVTLALRGVHDWPAREYFNTMKTLIQAQTDYFGGSHPANDLCIILHVLPEAIPPGVSAFNRWAPGNLSTIQAVHTPQRPRGHFEFYGMLSHEHLHNWYPNAMPSTLGPWFIEGLNDYVAYDILRTSGIHARKDTLDMMNKWVREYFDCLRNGHKELMPYRRGMIAAWIFDMEIQKATQGGKGLRDLLLALFRSAPTDGKVGKAEFLQELRELTGVDHAALYDTLVERDAPIRLHELLQGTIWSYDPEAGRVTLQDPSAP